jgi:hypothetical protein
VDLATLQTLVETDLSGPALQVYLTAATEAVDERLGGGTVTDVRIVHGPAFGMLSYPAAEVLEVHENANLVDPAYYALRPSGRLIDRLPLGRRWTGRVRAVYQRKADRGKRDRVIVGLVKLELVNNPGLASARFGSWAESYRAQGQASYAEEREALLGSLFDDDGYLA